MLFLLQQRLSFNCLFCRHCLKFAFIHLLIYFTKFFGAHCVLGIPDAGPAMLSKRFKVSVLMEYKVDLNGALQTVWQTASRVLCNISFLIKDQFWAPCSNEAYPWWWSSFPRLFSAFYMMVHKNSLAFIKFPLIFILYFFISPFFLFFIAAKNFCLSVALTLHELPWLQCISEDTKVNMHLLCQYISC